MWGLRSWERDAGQEEAAVVAMHGPKPPGKALMSTWGKLWQGKVGNV